jgi:minimal PKS chain-length factor (CLF/KS beta)
MNGRVAVTGMGLLTPNGLGLESAWQATLTGKNGIGPLSRFDTARYPARLAGEISDFDAAKHLHGKLLVQTDISTQFALVAADWAIADAKIEAGTYSDYEVGVVTANACGGFEFTHREFSKLWNRGPTAVSVYESFAWFYAVNTGQISIRNLLRGPSSAVVAEQAGGLDAIGHARRTIRRGCRAVVSGGVDSAFDPWGWVSQLADGRVSRATEPDQAYLPFAVNARGYVPGEGGALLVLEDLDAALRRKADHLYGEISGYASAFDPPPGSARPLGLRRAALTALSDAGLSPGQIGVVFADGVGVPSLDQAEAAAISAIFGPYGVPVTAPKGYTGRMYAGGSPADVAYALLSIRDGVIPPTPGGGPVPAEYRLNLVRQSRPATIDHALVLARGKGGFNAAVVVSRVNNKPDAARPHQDTTGNIQAERS